MVKRKCPVCGNYMFTANETKVCKCSCGEKLGPELNMQIGEKDKKPAAFPVVGEVLANGYMVLAIWKKEYVLAVSEDKNVLQPYVTWYLDQNGQTYGGTYFADKGDAERHFAALCFKWFYNNDELGMALSVFNQFKWDRNILSMIFDHENDVILFNEDALMRIIMMANPAQEPRPIRLISQDELLKRRKTKKKLPEKIKTPLMSDEMIVATIRKQDEAG
ncbi:MAG: hypothetical protein ACM3S4_04715 [Burkholderiales bacterium]